MIFKHSTALLILRIGIGFVFIYAAISSFLHPYDWIGYFPQQLRDLVHNDMLLLHLHSFGELILSLWIFSGYKQFYSAACAAIALCGIIIANLGAMDIVFRDVGLLLASLALAVESKATN